MACPLPEDVKKRALEKCASYPYLTVQDPGTVITGTDGRELVFVLDNKQRGLWLEVAPPRGAGEKEKDYTPSLFGHATQAARRRPR